MALQQELKEEKIKVDKESKRKQKAAKRQMERVTGVVGLGVIAALAVGGYLWYKRIMGEKTEESVK